MSIDLADVNLNEVNYRVFARPGAHISSLSNLIKYHDVSEAPDFIVLHVGTNSISYCGLLTRFLRQFRDLLDCVKSKFPNSTILVSELFVRTDLDVKRYNVELANLCKQQNIKVAKSSVTLQDLAWDGLYLLLDGHELFASDIHKAITRDVEKATIKFPPCMIPRSRRFLVQRRKSVLRLHRRARRMPVHHVSSAM